MTRQQENHGNDGRKSTRGRGPNQRHHRLSVRAIRRSPTDLRKLGRAIIEIELARVEAEAQAQTDRHHDAPEAASDEASDE